LPKFTQNITEIFIKIIYQLKLNKRGRYKIETDNNFEGEEFDDDEELGDEEESL